MSDNIKVVVKVRPLISREIDEKLPCQWRVQNNTLHQLDSNGRDFGQTFTFDKVYNEATKTTDVYNDVAKPIVEAATAGFNGTIFAYGQTSSGKTYTMTGTEASPGIVHLSVLNLFENIKNVPDRDFLVRVSYIEIYNETVKDLLDVKKENIKIHETYEGSIKVDASERVTSSPEDVLDAMREGEANRQTGATNMNEKSSRSHSIFQITIESREHIEGAEQSGCVNVSQLNLVDLAGSERARQTGATGMRFKEGTHINKSLSALALVIKQLSDGPNKHANYRDSKLTRILQNSLGGNAKTSIICAITLAALEETVSTLQFATRAKAIKNKPEVNAVATDATMIQGLTKQLSNLQSQLESKKNLEVILESRKHIEQDLQKQIANLQKLILNGFGQKSTIENIDGTRRKLQPPRRKTISTLHSIDEDPVPSIQKFCTPSLKYNPMVISTPFDFAPIQNTNKLSSLPEEPARLITPPPTDRKVNLTKDVIELDSDDDDNDPTLPTCSPYHSCYDEPQTPPCIRRENLNRAEKSYRDIVELTKREKIYQPAVEELLEKLELSTQKIARLQDETELLKKSSKEKDLEMDNFKCKIKKAEEEYKKAKLELEARCKEYDTKVTDWEVSYETLKKKAKLREEELLFLLEEQKRKKCEDIGKLSPKLPDKDTMILDMSKDISLVNSDNESSVITSTEEESEQMLDIVASLQDQLTDKCQNIVQLEANIASKKQSIELLEQSSHELQKLVDSFKEKLVYLENENGLLQCNLATLNATIKNQKENLERAQNDMVSYNSVIQELQIKITTKDNLLNMNITDSVLETMIANEEKVIANNENMKNIIHSFKIALDKRNKEVEQLRASIQETRDSQKLTEIVNDKPKEIEILNKEILKLKDQVIDNTATITKLTREKSYLACVEQDLTKQLAKSCNQNVELEKNNKENTLRIVDLNEINEKLLHSLTDKNESEQKYVKLNDELQNKIIELSNNKAQIEKEMKEKDIIICTLSKQSEDKHKYEHQAKLAIDKLKSIISILSGEIEEIPELIDNFTNLFNSLCSWLDTLENVASDTVAENGLLKTENSNLKNKYDMEIKELLHEIEDLKKCVDNYLIDNTNIKEINKKLFNDISNYQKEIDLQRNEHNIFIAQCDSSKDAENSLRNELLQKEEIILSLEVKLSDSIIASKSVHDQLLIKDDMITKFSILAEELKTELEQKCDEIKVFDQKFNNLAKEKDDLVQNIFRKLCDIASIANEFEIESDLSFEDVIENCSEHILQSLDKMISYISQINSRNVSTKHNTEHQQYESKKEIRYLFDENEELKNKLSQIENVNKMLSLELEKKNLDMTNINRNNVRSNELLEQSQVDLQCKFEKIQIMENKTKEWKDKFINLEIVKEQQIQDLQNEIDRIKSCNLSLVQARQTKMDIFSQETDDSSLEKTFLKLVSETENYVDTVSPPSLLTICCNKIVEVIEPKQNNYSLATSSSSDTEIQNRTDITSCPTCDQLSVELLLKQQENATLSAILEQLQITNKELMTEQENIRQEIQLLIEPAQGLQKKISSHKTNLSILTATTYAENRSLKSQVKGLQHHHSRFHNVCQRDIPEFKRQLRELLIILNGDSSVSEIQNVNPKRYSLPDVLDKKSTVGNFKNDTTLDGDTLMLDTNVTLTTTGDNTLVGYDQTCLDLTQTMFNEVSCQTSDLNQTDSNVVDNYVSELQSHGQNIGQSLEVMKIENCKLNVLVDSFPEGNESKADAQSSPFKISSCNDCILCTKCQNNSEMLSNVRLEKEIQYLTQKVLYIENERNNITKKYNNIILETPNTDSVLSKLSAVEKEYDIKTNEVTKLTISLNIKNKELKTLQEENDSLSTQVMENITEIEDLYKELETVKSENLELTEKVLKLISENNTFDLNDEVMHSVPSVTRPHAKLSRSFSDSETSSRYNKICTLQSELHAGREDCKVLTEDVATIKEHLGCSNISMDLDESMSDSNVISQATDFMSPNSQNTKCNMPDIKEEHPMDIYSLDKMDCYNYYLEIAGLEKEYVSNDVKIIDIMKMFYNKLLAKHGNEVENLANNLKHCEECRNKLQTQIDDMVYKYATLTKSIEEKEKNLSSVSKLISNITSNINRINNELNGPINNADFPRIMNMFKQHFLNTLDYEFGISSVSVFEFIVNKHQDDLMNIEKQCVSLQNQTETLNTELGITNNNLQEQKNKLAEHETEYKLLKAQKDKIHEISSAVTLDIVRKEQELQKSLSEGCKKLIEFNLITSDLDFSESASKGIIKVIDHVTNNLKLRNDEMENEKENLSIEVKKYKTVLEEKEKELIELTTQIHVLRDINNNVTLDLTDKEDKLHTLNTAHDDLSKAYENKIKENINNLNMIDILTGEITSLRESISNNESKISSLSEKNANSMELLNSIRDLQENNERLKSANKMILEEKESYSVSLEKSSETIKQDVLEMEKMTSDILLLRGSVKEATAIIESLKHEIQNLSMVNAELKQNFEEIKQDSSRLEVNIKTHEKTAEIQSRMIMRLQKQKEEDDKIVSDKQTTIDEISEKYNALQSEFEELKNVKESLEARVTELKEAADKPRMSLDAIVDSSRRRRQSIHDSRRLLGDLDEHKDVEAVFQSRPKPDDLFMDVDGDDTSGRSTPFDLGKGRDSLLSRTDQSDKDEDHSSRPSSVLATRRRRQSIHDMHRGVPRHTPSPNDLSRVSDEIHHLRDTSGNTSNSGGLRQLKEQLSSCQQELEDLKERYRELDEECETCAEYLKERDEQCMRLKKEKAALEMQVAELKSGNTKANQLSFTKPSVSHVAVNTDEDWANLHAVVVDRMSFDAEVDKNKRLTKSIEELRFQKQDLKNTISKMQKALEKHSSKDTRELVATKEELKSVKLEFEELKTRYKELDEECETCAEYLREREEQCRRLKEAKAALETKLEELQEDAHTLAHTHTLRKKRQTIHDMSRNSTVDQTDASTETSDDLLSYHVERDNSSQRASDGNQHETKRLKMIVEKLTHEKAALEKQLKTVPATPAPPSMYVATGSAIVQNQQLTDVMKENQRLKKMNAKLVNICKKRGKSDANRENEDPCEQG